MYLVRAKPVSLPNCELNMPLKIYQKTWFWYLTALIIVVLDQASKHAIEAAFEYGETLVFTSFFNFTLAYNTGAAFSFLADAGGWQRWFFAVIALAASAITAKNHVRHLLWHLSLAVRWVTYMTGLCWGM